MVLFSMSTLVIIGKKTHYNNKKKLTIPTIKYVTVCA